MKVGLFLPISGRAASPETLRESAQTAETLGFDSVWTADRIAKRDPSKICLGCCLPIELSQKPIPQEDDRIMGDWQQVLKALKAYQEIGVDHVALQFMAPRYPERAAQIERFGKEVLPSLKSLKG